jgi:Protein of unknown function (DUF2934)
MATLLTPVRKTTYLMECLMPADPQAIAERAYQLWEAKGRPEGEHEQIWIEAEKELEQAGSKPEATGVPEASKPTAIEKPRRR